MTLTVRLFASPDAPELTALLNAVIAQGGTTALEEAYTPDALTHTYLDGPDVHACLVAVDPVTMQIEGFQTLGRYPALPADVGDIGTFARIDGAGRGVGSALFAGMIPAARSMGLSAINATIRADNAGGLAFYAKQGFVDHAVTPAVPLANGTLVDRVHKRFDLSLAAGVPA